jgi:hypothetical protein
MAGSAGVGKSTLAEQLSENLRRRGHWVDVCGEEELFTRSVFAEIAEGYTTKQFASPEQFEAAYSAWLGGTRPGEVVITGWNPAAMAGDLPWAMSNRARFRSHLRQTSDLASSRLVLLHLDASAAVAVERSFAQRGESWLDRYDEVAIAAGHHHPDRVARIMAWTEDQIAATRAEVKAAADSGWPVHSIDAAYGPAHVRDQALETIADHLELPAKQASQPGT